MVEQEAAEQTVLGIRDEAADLLGRAGEDAADAGLVYADEFSVLAADVRDRLVVGELAEVVRVVAVVGTEGVGKGVAFGLEHDAAAVILVEHLDEGGGTGVCR